MTSQSGADDKLSRPTSGRRRWTSFVAPDRTAHAAVVRGLHEQANPQHRLRVEHDAHTLLVHLSDEDGRGWITFAVDRSTRRWAAARAPRQITSARDAYDSLYEP